VIKRRRRRQRNERLSFLPGAVSLHERTTRFVRQRQAGNNVVVVSHANPNLNPPPCRARARCRFARGRSVHREDHPKMTTARTVRSGPQNLKTR
jgi:hypothetical protein